MKFCADTHDLQRMILNGCFEIYLFLLLIRWIALELVTDILDNNNKKSWLWCSTLLVIRCIAKCLLWEIDVGDTF